MSEPKPHVWRDLGGLAVWSRFLLLAQAVVSTAAVVLALVQGPWLNETQGMAQAAVGIVQLLVFVVAGVVVLTWIARANANSHALGARNLNTGPFMAVAGYFIPIANLFMPAQSMSQMWKASLNPHDWETVKATPLILFWWAAWLIGNAMATFAFRLSLEDYVPDGPAVIHWLTVGSDALTVVASLLLAVLIGKITAQQRQTRSHTISAPQTT